MTPPPSSAAAPRDARPLAALALYLVGTFVGGGLLAPWLYAAVQALAAVVPALGEIAAMPFARYVNRALLLTALVGLPFFLRAAGIRSWRDAGLPVGGVPWPALGRAFALGFASLAAVCALALASGGRTLVPRSPGDLAAQFLGALATAAIVSVIEEVLFRGAMMGGLRRAMPWGWALAVSSLVYAAVHFLHRADAPAEVTWLSGLQALPSMASGIGDPAAVLPDLLNLALAGAILGLAFQRTGSLVASIGIHAGWIFWLKFYGLLTRGADPSMEWLWGTRRLVDGWLVTGALVLVVALLFATPLGARLFPRADADGPSAGRA